MDVIELLPMSEFKVLKMIRIVGPEWNRFTAFLPYIRAFDPKLYGSKRGDLLDERVLEIIKSSYPESHLDFSEDIMFKGQIEKMLNSRGGGTTKPVIVQFYPLVPMKEFAKIDANLLKAYPIQFTLRVWLNPGDKRLTHILDYFLCYLPYNEVEKLVKTIKPI